MLRDRILALGYFGKGNLGDDAILLNFLEIVHSTNHKIVVSTFNKVVTKTVYSKYNILTINVLNVFSIVYNAFRAKTIVFPGGGFRFDNSKFALLLFVLFCVKRSVANSWICFPIGVEPISSKLGAIIAKLFCKQFKLMYVRDGYSLKALNDAGVIGDNIEISVDPVFYLFRDFPSDNDGGDHVVNQAPLKIGVNVLNANNSKRYQRLFVFYVLMIDALLKMGHSVVLFPMSSGEGDMVLADEIALRVKRPDHLSIINCEHNPAKMLDEIRKMDFCVGMRFHFKVFSALAGVPFASITRSNKSKNICELLEQIEICNVDSLSEKESINMLIDAIYKRDHYRKKCNHHIENIKKSSIRANVSIQELLHEK